RAWNARRRGRRTAATSPTRTRGGGRPPRPSLNGTASTGVPRRRPCSLNEDAGTGAERVQADRFVGGRYARCGELGLGRTDLGRDLLERGAIEPVDVDRVVAEVLLRVLRIDVVERELHRLARVWPRALGVRIVVAPHHVGLEVVLDAELGFPVRQEARTNEAVPPEVLGRRLGQRGAHGGGRGTVVLAVYVGHHR